MRRFVVATGLALLASGLITGQASAGKNGPNNTAAKECQQTGYTSVFTSTGAAFVSADQCVSYAAQGGVLINAEQVKCLDGKYPSYSAVSPLGTTTSSPPASFASEASCMEAAATKPIYFLPVVVDPQRWDFGNVLVGTESVKTYTFTNNTTDQFVDVFSVLVLSGGSTGGSTTCLSGVLGPGSSCVVTANPGWRDPGSSQTPRPPGFSTDSRATTSNTARRGWPPITSSPPDSRKAADRRRSIRQRPVGRWAPSAPRLGRRAAPIACREPRRGRAGSRHGLIPWTRTGGGKL